MTSATPVVAAAAKLSTVMPVGTTITVIGLALFAAGWFWLIYQNGRFGVAHGVLSVVPLYALFFAFWRLEHAHKSGWTTIFLCGAMLGGLGYSIRFAAEDCENNDACGRRLEIMESGEQGADQAEEGLLRSPLLPESG